jgi:hypothetical protein
MIALSFSRMKDMECPFRFNALYIEKSHKEPESEPMRVGSAVARILATYRSHCIKNGIRNDAGLLSDLKITVEDGLAEKVVPLLSRFAKSEFVHVPIDAEWHQVEGRLAFDGSLIPIEGDRAWFDSSVAFRSVVDFAYFDPQEGVLDITDDKAGWGDPDELQLRVYAHLCKTAWMRGKDVAEAMQLKKIRARFNNIAQNTVNEIELHPEETNSMRELILGKIAEVNMWAEHPATACSLCRYCTVPECPVRKAGETALVASEGCPVTEVPIRILSPDEARKAVQFIDFADGIVGTVKEALRKWVEDNGPVVSGSRIANFSERESWEVRDLAVFCKMLTRLGAPPEMVWQNLGLTKSAVEKIVKKAKLADQMPLLMSMIDKKTTRSFGIRNDRTV